MRFFKFFRRSLANRSPARRSQPGAAPSPDPMVESLPIGPGLIYPDLLPENVWGSNLRGLLPKSDWDRLRIPVCEAAGDRCEVCGQPGFDPRTGRARRPDCHELWSFEIHGDRFVQRLTRLIALDADCHRVQHVGRAGAVGEMELVLMQLRAVNTWNDAEIQLALDNAADRYRWRRQYEWDLDLSLLAGQIRLSQYPDLLIPAAHRRFLGNSFFEN